MTTFRPRPPLTQQSRLPGDDDDDGPELVPLERERKPFTRWQRR